MNRLKFGFIGHILWQRLRSAAQMTTWRHVNPSLINRENVKTIWWDERRTLSWRSADGWTRPALQPPPLDHRSVRQDTARPAGPPARPFCEPPIPAVPIHTAPTPQSSSSSNSHPSRTQTHTHTGGSLSQTVTVAGGAVMLTLSPHPVNNYLSFNL